MAELHTAVMRREQSRLRRLRPSAAAAAQGVRARVGAALRQGVTALLVGEVLAAAATLAGRAGRLQGKLATRDDGQHEESREPMRRVLFTLWQLKADYAVLVSAFIYLTFTKYRRTRATELTLIHAAT